MENRKKLLLLILIKKILRKKKAYCKTRFIFNIVNQIYLRQTLLNNNVILLFALSQDIKERRYWAMEYDQAWFERMWQNRNDEIFSELWHKEFRMSPSTFEYLISLVEQSLSKVDTAFRKAVPIEKRVAVALWRLSTGNSYRTISKVFGIGKSTVIKLFQEFVRELLMLSPEFIKFPKTALETCTAIKAFQESTDCVIPQALGAIDGTHIEILAPPSDSKVDYFSRKQKFTVNTQGVIGANLMFLDVATGYPGSIHNARMLRSSELFHLAENEEILARPLEVVDNIQIHVLCYLAIVHIPPPFGKSSHTHSLTF